jgi:hypothetical protein
MEQFLALLFAYYTCDAAAQAQQPLGGDRLACVETYEEVKAFFAPLDPAPFGTPEYGAAAHRDLPRLQRVGGGERGDRGGAAGRGAGAAGE